VADGEQQRELQGQSIAGKFRIERLLGAGAMGEVWVAEQLSLGKRVAIKVLHRHLAGEKGIAKRFHREARAASILEHPNCVHIIDFGETDGLLYIAMELLSGRDLLKVIKSDSPLSTGRIVHLMGQILGALDEAHAKGVVHRDLKPENVMVSDLRGQRDFVKVCDFGIAKLTSERESASAITVAGMVCGTPEYMSPEQARGDELDGRSDLYAAACILYQMVVGDVPFRAGSALGVVTKQLMETPQPPSQRRPDLPIDPALEALILRGLEKDREKRWPSAAAMKDALLEVASPSAPELRTPTPAPMPGAQSIGLARTEQQFPTPTPASASTPSLAAEMVVAPARPSRTWLAVALAVVATGGAAGIAAFAMHKTPPQPIAALNPPAPPPAAANAPAPAPEVAPVVAPPTATTPVPLPPPPATDPAPSAKPEHHHHAASKPHAPPNAPAPSSAPAPAVSPPPPPSSAPAPAHGFAALFAEGQALFSSGDTEKAAARYEDAARVSPDNAVVHRELGKCYSRLGQRDRATKEYRRYLELAPNASDARFYRSIVGQ